MHTTLTGVEPTLIRQGDVLLTPCDPNDLGQGGTPHVRRAVKRVAGLLLVLATSKSSGHAHAIVEPHARLEVQFQSRRPSGQASPIRRTVLLVEREPATLLHKEHDPVVVPPGAYRVGRSANS